MMRDIGACFYCAQSGFNKGKEDNFIEKPMGSLPLNMIKTVTEVKVDLSSVVVHGLNCFFNGLIIYIHDTYYFYKKTIEA